MTSSTAARAPTRSKMPLKSIPKGHVRVASGTIRSTFFPLYSEAGQASPIISSTCSLVRKEPGGLHREMVGDDIDTFNSVAVVGDCHWGVRLPSFFPLGGQIQKTVGAFFLGSNGKANGVADPSPNSDWPNQPSARP